ncbi:RNA-guided endonuclease InsQ/TnpB family protein [Microbacterium enclense]|uniref:RNA-guided endonuclease InsQ/TnpB family protein n=1 Tax=Microbacterium enclense TaxID=993073 RepID=UPI003F7F73EA
MSEMQNVIVKLVVDESALTAAQRDIFLRHAGAARKAWNWALASHNEYQDALQSIVRERSLAQCDSDRERAQLLRRDRNWSRPAYAEARAHLKDTRPDLHHNVSMIATVYRFRQMVADQAAAGDSDWGWWANEAHGVQKASLNYVFDDLGKAIARFYKNPPPPRPGRPRKLRNDGRPDGWPRFKSKKVSPPNFALLGSIGSPVVSAHRVALPAGIGQVRVHNHTKRLQALIAKGGVTTQKTIRVTRAGGRWQLSFFVQTPAAAVIRPLTSRQRSAGVVGVDQGVARRLALSDGTFVENPRLLSAARRRVTRASRDMARKRRARERGQEPSARYTRSKERLARAQARTAATRDGFLHRITSELAARWQTIVVEDLAVESMTRSAKGTLDSPGRNVRQKAGLNRALLDASFGELRRKLEYKSMWRGGAVIAVPAAYTSQTCNACGHTAPENRETQAAFRCTACGHAANADTNAARNIRDAGVRTLACDGGRGETDAEVHTSSSLLTHR